MRFCHTAAVTLFFKNNILTGEFPPDLIQLDSIPNLATFISVGTELSMMDQERDLGVVRKASFRLRIMNEGTENKTSKMVMLLQKN